MRERREPGETTSPARRAPPRVRRASSRELAGLAEVTVSRPDGRPVRPSGRTNIVVDALSLARGRVVSLAERAPASLLLVLEQAFGERDHSGLVEALARGVVPMPRSVRFVPAASLTDRSSAYSPDSGGEILLSASLRSELDPLERALLEEMGRHIDESLGGRERHAAEGAIFAEAIIAGRALSDARVAELHRAAEAARSDRLLTEVSDHVLVFDPLRAESPAPSRPRWFLRDRQSRARLDDDLVRLSDASEVGEPAFTQAVYGLGPQRALRLFRSLSAFMSQVTPRLDRLRDDGETAERAELTRMERLTDRLGDVLATHPGELRGGVWDADLRRASTTTCARARPRLDARIAQAPAWDRPRVGPIPRAIARVQTRVAERFRYWLGRGARDTLRDASALMDGLHVLALAEHPRFAPEVDGAAVTRSIEALLSRPGLVEVIEAAQLGAALDTFGARGIDALVREQRALILDEPLFQRRLAFEGPSALLRELAALRQLDAVAAASTAAELVGQSIANQRIHELVGAASDDRTRALRLALKAAGCLPRLPWTLVRVAAELSATVEELDLVHGARAEVDEARRFALRMAFDAVSGLTARTRAHLAGIAQDANGVLALATVCLRTGTEVPARSLSPAARAGALVIESMKTKHDAASLGSWLRGLGGAGAAAGAFLCGTAAVEALGEGAPVQEVAGSPRGHGGPFDPTKWTQLLLAGFGAWAGKGDERAVLVRHGWARTP